MTRLYLSRTNQVPNLKFAREYVIFTFVYPTFYLFSTFSYDKFNFVVAFLSLSLDNTFYQNNNSRLCLSLIKQVYYLFFHYTFDIRKISFRLCLYFKASIFFFQRYFLSEK